VDFFFEFPEQIVGVKLLQILYISSLLWILGSLEEKDVVLLLELSRDIHCESSFVLKFQVLALVLSGVVVAVHFVLRSKIIFVLIAVAGS